MVGNIKNPNHILGPGIIKEKNPLARMKEFFAHVRLHDWNVHITHDLGYYS